MTLTYCLHGLRVHSELPIPAPTLAADCTDVEVCWGERRPIPDEMPAGRLLGLRKGGDGAWSVVLTDRGHTLRAHGLCDFEMDLRLRQVTVHLATDASREWAQLLLGSALSTLLSLRGHSVLHASAVQTDLGVVAFVGGSGRGKTTLAALCCAAGAALVSDDVLRVESSDGRAWCFSGSRELRLRPAAAELAGILDSGREHTVDGRVGVRPRWGGTGRLPLVAVVAPACVHGGDRLQIERRRGRQAVMELISHPHATGWADAESARRDFSVLTGLTTSVPVYRAQVPWGPPFSPAWATSLLEAVLSRQAVGAA
jgi:hypothetical protein